MRDGFFYFIFHYPPRVKFAYNKGPTGLFSRFNVSLSGRLPNTSSRESKRLSIDEVGKHALRGLHIKRIWKALTCSSHIQETSFFYFVLKATTLNLCSRLAIGLVCKTFLSESVVRLGDMMFPVCWNAEFYRCL